MTLALMLCLLGVPPGAASPVRSDDPPIRVWLNHDGDFRTGDKARVHVKLAEDGYLVVLRADGDGRVRVLFPHDPGDEARVRGGRKIEIHGRNDREAFFVEDREGTGLVLAARAVASLKVDEFVRGDHWDYRALGTRDTAAAGDDEQALLDIVHRMVPDGRFDYDLVRYTVGGLRAYHDRRYYPRYAPIRLGVSFGWGRPYYRHGFYRACFDPFWYDPFFCPAFYDPFRYGRVSYRSYLTGGVFDTGGFTFKQGGAPPVSGIGPRFRAPEGVLLKGRAAPARGGGRRR